jgi:hypothetical protein
MKHLPHLTLLLASLSLAGCGGDAAEDVTMAPPPAAPAVADMAPPAATASVTAPPSGAAPATINAGPDALESIKVSNDGSPNKTDLEALQAVVDGYSFGIDGLGAPPIASLDVLVAKGLLKRIPTPPEGKRWAYDSAKWKVSLVDK